MSHRMPWADRLLTEDTARAARANLARDAFDEAMARGDMAAADRALADLQAATDDA